MSQLNILFASITAITAIFAIALPIWLARTRHGLRWAILMTKSMMEIAEEIASDMTIQYKGRTITDMTKYQFILHNTGRTPIEESDIVVPLKWTGPGAILAAHVVATYPPVDLSLSIHGNAVHFRWPLFNQSSKALIEILCEGGSAEEKGQLSGQIRAIPSIEEKRVSVVDEYEESRVMEMSMQLTTPKIFRPLIRIFSNPRFLRLRRPIGIVYFGSATVFLIWLSVVDFVDPDQLPVVIPLGIFLTAALFGGLFLFFRNPYATLVKKARETVKPTSVKHSVSAQ